MSVKTLGNVQAIDTVTSHARGKTDFEFVKIAIKLHTLRFDFSAQADSIKQRLQDACCLVVSIQVRRGKFPAAFMGPNPRVFDFWIARTSEVDSE
jgi:hypothetical protein